MSKFFTAILTAVLLSSVFTVSAYAKSEVLAKEAAEAQKQLPVNVAQGMICTDIEYEAGKGFTYTYTVDNTSEITKESIKEMESAILTQVCALPYFFVNSLIKDKTPIVYKYHDTATKKLIGQISTDMKKCSR